MAAALQRNRGGSQVSMRFSRVALKLSRADAVAGTPPDRPAALLRVAPSRESPTRLQARSRSPALPSWSGGAKVADEE